MTVRRVFCLALVIAFAAASAVVASAEEKKEAFKYVGVKTCKMCHNKAETGKQYEVWLGSAHAKAYASLASPEAVAKAKELGLGDPQKEAKCLECHVTAFSVRGDSTQKVTVEEGVTCEGCHGPGSGYKTKKVKDGIVAGQIEPASVGLRKPAEADCRKCHKAEGNPFFKEFNFEEYSKKIAHPNPAKKKS